MSANDNGLVHVLDLVTDDGTIPVLAPADLRLRLDALNTAQAPQVLARLATDLRAAGLYTVGDHGDAVADVPREGVSGPVLVREGGPGGPVVAVVEVVEVAT